MPEGFAEEAQAFMRKRGGKDREGERGKQRKRGGRNPERLQVAQSESMGIFVEPCAASVDLDAALSAFRRAPLEGLI